MVSLKDRTGHDVRKERTAMVTSTRTGPRKGVSPLSDAQRKVLADLSRRTKPIRVSRPKVP